MEEENGEETYFYVVFCQKFFPDKLLQFFFQKVKF